jgi:hypothetical protein
MNLAFIALLAAIVPAPEVVEPNAYMAFARDGMIYDMSMGGWPGHVTPDEAAMFDNIELKGMSLPLYAKPLSEIRAAFGGDIQRWDNVGYVHNWLCYVDGGQRVWFLTDSGDTPEFAIVGWLVAEPSNPETDALYHCSNQPLAMVVPGAGYPTIGTSRAELGAHFGAPLAEDADRVVYFLQDTVPGEGYELVRTVYYRLKDGIVDGVSFSQWDDRM